MSQSVTDQYIVRQAMWDNKRDALFVCRAGTWQGQALEPCLGDRYPRYIGIPVPQAGCLQRWLKRECGSIQRRGHTIPRMASVRPGSLLAACVRVAQKEDVCWRGGPAASPAHIFLCSRAQPWQRWVDYAVLTMLSFTHAP